MKASSFMDFFFFVGKLDFCGIQNIQSISMNLELLELNLHVIFPYFSPSCQVIPLLSSSLLLLSSGDGARLDPKIYQVECQNMYYIYICIYIYICQIKCQMECQIDCQNVCQIECQWMGITERKYCIFVVLNVANSLFIPSKWLCLKIGYTISSAGDSSYSLQFYQGVSHFQTHQNI